MSNDLSPEEKKIIYHAVRYWQIHKAPLDGKDYKLCDQILTGLFDDVYTQKQEQST